MEKKKGYIEFECPNEDYKTINLVPGVAEKLNIGDKIAINRNRIKDPEFMADFLSEDSRRLFSNNENTIFGTQNKSFIIITEKIHHEFHIELNGILHIPEQSVEKLVTLYFPELGDFCMQVLQSRFTERLEDINRIIIPIRFWDVLIKNKEKLDKMEKPNHYPAKDIYETMTNYRFIVKESNLKDLKLYLILDLRDTAWIDCNWKIDFSKDMMISFLSESKVIESINFPEASIIAPLFKRSNFAYLFSDENGGCDFQRLIEDENGQPYTSGGCSISKTEKCLQYLKEIEKEDEILKSIDFLANLIKEYKDKTDADELDFSMREK
jgi:hypothetical protein